MNSILIRRSIRQFSGKQVEKDLIDSILRAAMQAPSAGNQRPWEFIVVDQREVLEKLSKASQYASPVKNAPLAIVLIADKERMRFEENYEQDMGACAQNILLQATEHGLGSVWLGIAPLEDRMNAVREIFDLDENLLPYAIIPIGYPSDKKANHFADRFEADRIHYNKY